MRTKQCFLVHVGNFPVVMTVGPHCRRGLFREPKAAFQSITDRTATGEMERFEHFRTSSRFETFSAPPSLASDSTLKGSILFAAAFRDLRGIKRILCKVRCDGKYLEKWTLQP